jgi:glycerophosphoryl diester phosphodiesterase
MASRKRVTRLTTLLAVSCVTAPSFSQASPMSTQNPFTALMIATKAHADAHHAMTPAISPLDASLLTTDPKVDVPALHALGIRVVPWTTNDPIKMKAIIALHVDGLISDRPDLLQQALAEARATDSNIPANFDVEGHRGGRGLRPENTLPAFEAGLDNLIHTIETDTGVTADHHSIIWHDQFLNPESCRRADGKPYDYATAYWHRDHTLAELQSTFICDNLHSARFPDQKNDLALSPVAVAFAAKEHMLSPYSPTYADQLFRFTAFYADYYRSGPGKHTPNAAARAANADRVHFNLETKVLPFPDGGTTPPQGNEEPTTNHTFAPQVFVDTLTKAIHDAHMESRADIQSFDFRTLQLVEEQHPDIPTFYLTERPTDLSSDLIPSNLRQPVESRSR